MPLRRFLRSALLLGACLAVPAPAAPAPDGGSRGARARPFATGKLSWPEVEVVDEIDVPGVSVVDGRPVRLHALRVKGRVEDLFGEYYRAFQRAGFFLPPGQSLSQLSPQEVGLAALDVAGKRSYVVVFQPNGRHDDTTVVLGTVDLSQPLIPAPLDGIPVPPDAKGLVRASSEGGDVLHFEVSGAAEPLLAFYRETLSRAGFHEDRESKGLSGPRFIQGGRELEIRLTPSPSGTGTRALVLMHGGVPPPQSMDAAVQAAERTLESRAVKADAGH